MNYKIGDIYISSSSLSNYDGSLVARIKFCTSYDISYCWAWMSKLKIDSKSKFSSFIDIDSNKRNINDFLNNYPRKLLEEEILLLTLQGYNFELLTKGPN